MTYHVLISLLGLVQGEDGLVNNGVDVVGLNGSAHVLHELPAADVDTANSADSAEGLEDALLGLSTTEETNDGDDTLVLDGNHALAEGAGTTDLNNVVNTLVVGGELAGGLAPVGVLAVVDDVISTELLEHLGLLLGGGGGDHLGTTGLGELEGKEGDTTGTLGEDPLAGLEGLEAVEGVPRSHTGAHEGGGLNVVKVGGGADDAVLVEDTVLAEGAIENTAEARGGSADVDVAELVPLVEESGDLVALLPLGDLGANGNDLTGTIGGGNDGEVDGERVLALYVFVSCLFDMT